MDDGEKLTQQKQILGHMRLHGSISPLVALKKYGCMRLGARIYDLKKTGVAIGVKRVEKKGKHYASYYLIEA